jgi:hypothetical protein
MRRALLIPFALAASFKLGACRSDPLDPIDAGSKDGATTSKDGATTSKDGATTPDASDRLPWDSDLILTVQHLKTESSRTAWLRINDTAENVRTPWQPATVHSGEVKMTWPGGYDRKTYGIFVELFVDRDGDGKCTEGNDPAWNLFLSNDFKMGAYKATIDLASMFPGADPVACSSFEP